MNPEKQRIAIAEACGWKRYNQEGLDAYHPENPNARFPDYLNDLNAMHEAEKILWPSYSTEYENLIYDIVSCVSTNKTEWLYITATAAIRAAAFLQILNLWEEDS